jgi:hypothetical protein
LLAGVFEDAGENRQTRSLWLALPPRVESTAAAINRSVSDWRLTIIALQLRVTFSLGFEFAIRTACAGWPRVFHSDTSVT